MKNLKKELVELLKKYGYDYKKNLKHISAIKVNLEDGDKPEIEVNYKQ